MENNIREDFGQESEPRKETVQEIRFSIIIQKQGGEISLKKFPPNNTSSDEYLIGQGFCKITETLRADIFDISGTHLNLIIITDRYDIIRISAGMIKIALTGGKAVYGELDPTDVNP